MSVNPPPAWDAARGAGADPAGSTGALPGAQSPGAMRAADDSRSGPGRFIRAALGQLSAGPLTLAFAALNHVIRQQGWARQRLRPFAGHLIELALDGDSPPARLLPPLQARIADDGSLRATVEGRNGAASLTLWLRPSLDLIGAVAAADREDRIGAHLRIEGDVRLASVLAELARHLRWDVEDDLSRLVGDVAAHRLSRGAQSARDEARRLATRAQDSALQFVTTEQPMLVAGSLCRDRAIELNELEQRIERLRARVARLSHGPSAISADGRSTHA